MHCTLTHMRSYCARAFKLTIILWRSLETKESLEELSNHDDDGNKNPTNLHIWQWKTVFLHALRAHFSSFDILKTFSFFLRHEETCFAVVCYFYSLYNLWKDELYRISRSDFHEWLFGPEKFSALSRNGPQGPGTLPWPSSLFKLR